MLENISEISQFIGQIENPLLRKIRDLSLYYCPQIIKGKIFDIALYFVTSFQK